MSTADPRVLIPLLEDTQQGVVRATAESRAAIDRALATQQQLGEHVTRFHQRVGLLAEQVAHEGRLAEALVRAVEDALVRVDGAQARADHALAAARQVRARSERTHEHWRCEVARATRRVADAEAWVTRATAAVALTTAWVERATADRDQAQAELRTAERHESACEHRLRVARDALAQAEAALAACERSVVYRTDGAGNTYPTRPDCSSHRVRVAQVAREVRAAADSLRQAIVDRELADRRLRAAEAELTRATAALVAARHDLANARAELAAAQQDLHRCRVALGKAEQAVRLATQATEYAGFAVATAAEGRLAATAARTAADQVQGWHHRQEQLAAALSQLTRQADASLSGGAVEGRLAEAHGLRAAELAQAANADLAGRIDMLRELERTYGLS